MLFVLAGPSYVGKKTAISHFIKLYSFSSIIPYTTKERKPEETDGIQYHFVDDAFFAEHGDDFILDKPFNCSERQDGDIYAYNKEHLRTAIKSYSNFIIHASVNNAIKISNEFKNENSREIYIIFLDYNTPLTEEFFKNKIRRPISEEDFYKRFYHAQKERKTYRKNSGKFDNIFKADDPYDIVNQIEEFVLPKLEVMPTMPDKIPGPLSGEDILYMAFRRRTDNLIVKKDNKSLGEKQLKEILSGCGLHITLNSKIRKTKKLCWNNYIDMAAKEQDISAKLFDLYPATLITSGYVLAPNEMILCTSNEYIEIPIDVYAIASSRFSYSQLGLTIELATSIIHAGHKGQIHFQIMNNTKNYICIYPNIEIAQLVFFRTIHPSMRAYSEYGDSHQYDKGTIPPLSNFRNKNSALDNIGPSLKNTTKPLIKKGIEFLTKRILPFGAIGLLFVVLLVVGCSRFIPEETLLKLAPILDGLKIDINISFPELFLLFIVLEAFHELLLLLWKGIIHLFRIIKLHMIINKD